MAKPNPAYQRVKAALEKAEGLARTADDQLKEALDEFDRGCWIGGRGPDFRADLVRHQQGVQRDADDVVTAIRNKLSVTEQFLPDEAPVTVQPTGSGGHRPI